MCMFEPFAHKTKLIFAWDNMLNKKYIHKFLTVEYGLIMMNTLIYG